MILRGEGGGWSGSLCRVRIFISDLLRATIFIIIQFQHRPFILRYSLFESDGLFIYFPRDAGQNIYLKVFDGQDIYFKKLSAPHPPLRINCSSPNKRRDQFQPFPNSTDCHTKHIAMPHGLWHVPRINQRQSISQNFSWKNPANNEN